SVDGVPRVRSSDGLPYLQLAGDEGLDHGNGPICLRARMNDPAVIAAWEDLVVDLTASGPVRRNEALLDLRQDIVIQFPLQDEHRRQADRLTALKDALRIALEDGLPRVEIHLAVGDQAIALHLLGLLVAGEGIADRRAGDDVVQR